MRRKKNIVIVAMCIAMLFMAVGYALLSTRLDIAGSTVVTSSWKVEFSAIRTVDLKGGATNKITPTASGTTANFEVDLVMPGDEVVYEIDITNYGDIVAEVKSATYSGVGSDAIYVQMEGIRKGTLIQSCEGMTVCPKVTLILKVGYDATLTEIPKDKTKDISITLNVGQYVPGSPVADGVLIPELANISLAQKVLSSNKALSDTSIDFSSTTSGYSGLYYTSTNTEDNKITYYFRGNVENNYVKFGKDKTTNTDIIWRIVRINEDGSVRLVTDKSVGSTYFASATDDNAYVGYMHGTPNSSTYQLTHANENNSIAKDFLDDWYVNTSNLSDYGNLMSTSTGFCNDRSTAPSQGTWIESDTALGYGTNVTYYGPANRIVDFTNWSTFNAAPIFRCLNRDNDLFTVTNASIGNKSLTYPVGLLTVDEVVYAGAVHSGNTSYLVNGVNFWTMSPYRYNLSLASSFQVQYDGVLFMGGVRNKPGIRPVINVNSNARVLSGNGSSGNPYVIG